MNAPNDNITTLIARIRQSKITMSLLSFSLVACLLARVTSASDDHKSHCDYKNAPRAGGKGSSVGPPLIPPPSPAYCESKGLTRLFGFQPDATSCDECGGTGKSGTGKSEPCRSCEGYCNLVTQMTQNIIKLSKRFPDTFWDVLNIDTIFLCKSFGCGHCIPEGKDDDLVRQSQCVACGGTGYAKSTGGEAFDWDGAIWEDGKRAIAYSHTQQHTVGDTVIKQNSLQDTFYHELGHIMDRCRDRGKNYSQGESHVNAKDFDDRWTSFVSKACAQVGQECTDYIPMQGEWHKEPCDGPMPTHFVGCYASKAQHEDRQEVFQNLMAKHRYFHPGYLYTDEGPTVECGCSLGQDYVLRMIPVPKDQACEKGLCKGTGILLGKKCCSCKRKYEPMEEDKQLGNRFAIIRAKSWWQFFTINQNDHIFKNLREYAHFWNNKSAQSADDLVFSDANGKSRVPYALGKNQVFLDPCRLLNLGSGENTDNLQTLLKLIADCAEETTYDKLLETCVVTMSSEEYVTKFQEGLAIHKELKIFTISCEDLGCGMTFDAEEREREEQLQYILNSGFGNALEAKEALETARRFRRDDLVHVPGKGVGKYRFSSNQWAHVNLVEGGSARVDSSVLTLVTPRTRRLATTEALNAAQMRRGLDESWRSALTNSTTEETMTPSERVLHRRRLSHGVRTPVVLSLTALMTEIEEAQRNWTPRRR